MKKFKSKKLKEIEKMSPMQLEMIAMNDDKKHKFIIFSYENMKELKWVK
jgi:hypothetical protein